MPTTAPTITVRDLEVFADQLDAKRAAAISLHVGALSYAVDTTLKNGALHVVPGSHKWGVMKHVDTSSHLGLDPKEWTFDKAVRIDGAAGDAIFFHVKTIHGSPENHSDKPRPVF